MKVKLVADSSCNIFELDGFDFQSVPLIISTKEKEFIDDALLNLKDMLSYLKDYKGKSGSACPGVGEWLEAFGDADIVYGTTITSGLSGSYNSAMNAADIYMEENPGKKVFIQDSLSTGPEPVLILEKFVEFIKKGFDFDEVFSNMTAYVRSTRLSFSLGSVNNLAKNGRVNPALAKLMSVLKVYVVGKASDKGELEQTDKCRGEKGALRQLWKNMLKEGYRGGKVRLHHTQNPEAAELFASTIRDEYPDADIKIGENRGLCSFYAEEGSLLVGYEVAE